MSRVEQQTSDDTNSSNSQITNPQIKRLFQKHRKLDQEIAHLDKYARYSHTVQAKQAQMKKEKLRYKDLLALVR